MAYGLKASSCHPLIKMETFSLYLTTLECCWKRCLPGGTPKSNGYECKAHTSKGWGIRWEYNLKNEGSLGEKPNFGSKLGGIGWECYFWPFSEHFKSRNLEKKKSKMAKMVNLLMKLKQIVASCGSRMQKK